MGSPIEDLLRLMGKSEKLRTDVRQKLLKGGKGIFEHLVRALRNPRSSTVRRNAALILGEMGNRKAVEPLIRALEDRAASVSCNAAIALGMIGDKRAVSPLLRRLASTSWQVRLNAAISLGWMAAPEAVRPLLRLLRDHHPYVRRGAAFALGQLGDWNLRDPLIQQLTDAKEPVYEAAVALAYLGDLSGYLYLDFPLPSPLGELAQKKPRKRALESLRLGNLFYSSSLYPAALAEYRRALGFKEKVSSVAYLSILNNLGNAFRAVGQPDHAVVFYLLALRVKPRNKNIQENLRKAEVLADAQELILEKVRRWMGHREQASLEPPPEISQFFRSIVSGLKPELKGKLLPHLITGWKSFYALEAYKKEEIFSAQTVLPPDFLTEQLPVCRAILTSEPSFRSFYLLLLRLSESCLAGGNEGEENPEILATLHEGFACGYLAGLLQKIWGLSHLRFSTN